MILSDHDLAVMQKAVAAARQDGKEDRQDAAAGQHETGPGPGPPAEEPPETRPPEARCSAPPPAITQALPAASPAPPWGSALILVPGPRNAVGGAGGVSGPAAVRGLNESRTRRRRRLLLYALAAAIIVAAAALADHWSLLPRVGAHTSSSPAQVGGPPHRPHLLPPLGQPPVMHLSNEADATPAPAEPSGQPASPAAEPAGAQNPAARPAGRPAS